MNRSKPGSSMLCLFALALPACHTPMHHDAMAEQAVKDVVAPIVLGEQPVPTGMDLEAMRVLMGTWQMRIDSKKETPR